MLNSINSAKDTSINGYSVQDMHDLASLAECDMQWMSTAIDHIKRELKILGDLAGPTSWISGSQFSELMAHLDMYEYIAAHRLSHYSEKAKVYDAKMEENKKAESL